jgi:regulator of nucleoside diphosphate kinase
MSLTIETEEKWQFTTAAPAERAGGASESRRTAAEATGITITDADFRQLKELIQRYRASWRTYGPYLNAVERELQRARIVAAEVVDPDVVTLNSRVELRDLATEQVFSYLLVLPDDTRGREDRLSVLAPLGTAILGASAGDVIRWAVPAGIRTVRVERVEQQTAAR